LLSVMLGLGLRRSGGQSGDRDRTTGLGNGRSRCFCGGRVGKLLPEISNVRRRLRSLCFLGIDSPGVHCLGDRFVLNRLDRGP
jgi:hypothetical protein